MQVELESLLSPTRIIPVVVINHLDDALPLAESLIEGGLSVLEITLRTEVAIPAIEQIKSAFPSAVIGAGTVLTQDQYRLAHQAGCEFMVSPGFGDLLHQAMIETNIPYLPGVTTITEIMKLKELGYQLMKFFPAELNGGASFLKAANQVFPHLKFFPTGGIRPEIAKKYLELPNVLFIGGTWMVDQHLIQKKDFPAIKALALEAAKL